MHILALIFITLGPKLPSVRYDHSVASINKGKGLAVIGGKNYFGQLEDSIDVLECRNQICSWNRINHRMKTPRSGLVAVGVDSKELNCDI